MEAVALHMAASKKMMERHIHSVLPLTESGQLPGTALCLTRAKDRGSKSLYCSPVQHCWGCSTALLSYKTHAQVAEALFDAIAASEAATPSMRIFVAVDKADVRRQAAESTARLASARGRPSTCSYKDSLGIV